MTSIALVSIVALPVAAQKTTTPPPIVIKPGVVPLNPVVISTAKMTTFDPTKHAFKFTNTFKTVTGVFDVTTGGLCGGMIYATLDYFKARKAPPVQSYTPIQGTTLQRYLLERNMTALGDHMDKWVELHLNPLGARDNEFFRWGLQGTGGGRLQELRAHIDRGDPVPLGLKSLTGDPGADHVVLAYGYDMGRYKGDLGQYQEDLKIFVYEPNYGAQKVTMVPKPDRNMWCNVERNRRGDEVCWRTYFVQQNYHAQTAPTIPASPRELVIAFRTGGDDLRGGDDNVHVTVNLRGGRTVRADNVNMSQRWIDHTWQDVGVSLPAGTNASDVVSIGLTTTFGGGIGGDNWNLDEFQVKFNENGVTRAVCNRNGGPLVRFTGDHRTWSTNFPC